MSGAGEGNRTLVSSLGSYSSTIELRPRGTQSMPAARGLATRWSATAGQNEGPARGPFVVCSHRMRRQSCQSETTAERGEHARVVATALRTGGADADVGIQ